MTLNLTTVQQDYSKSLRPEEGSIVLQTARVLGINRWHSVVKKACAILSVGKAAEASCHLFPLRKAQIQEIWWPV